MSDDKTIIADSIGMTTFNPKSKNKACLVQYNGSSLGKRYILEDAEIVAGRSQENSLVISEQSISRQHAKFVQTEMAVAVEDLGATNGTFVNDVRITERTTLKDGDIIRFGTILLKFFAHNNIENVFHDKIYRMATIDAGTQIFNKKYLMESLETEFKFAKTYDRPLCLIMYDLDFFKKVNDEHGHNAGDFILKEAANLVSSLVRKEDVFGRFGGEEFCVLLPGSDISTAADLAERIRKNCEEYTFEFEGKSMKQTLSVGVSQYNSNMANPKDLLEEADQKLYKSKAEGRNRVTC